MNNSIGFDGVYNVNLDLTKKFGVLENWNYNNSMSYYEDECAEVRGSAGEFYPKNLRPDRLQYFCTDMCRAMDFTFEKNTSVEGVPSFKYSMGERILDNGTAIFFFFWVPSGIRNGSTFRFQNRRESMLL